MTDTEHDGFLKGIAYALARVVEVYDQPTMAGDIIDGTGLSLEDFEKAGVDEYDLDFIKKVFDEEVEQ